jgi:hypothetical protein
METLEDSLRAIQELNGSKFLGRKLRMNLGNSSALEEEQEPSFQMHVSFISHNTNFTINEEQLDRIFSQFGSIKDCIVKQFSISTNPAKQCGYGFVFFQDEDSVNRAVRASNFSLIENIHFDCKMSHHTATKGPRPPPSAHSISHVTNHNGSASSTGENSSNPTGVGASNGHSASFQQHVATPVVDSPISNVPRFIPPVTNNSNHESPQVLAFSQFPPSSEHRQFSPNQNSYYSFPASIPPVLRTPPLVPVPAGNRGHSVASVTSVGTNSLPWSGGSGPQLLPPPVPLQSSYGVPHTLGTWPMFVAYPPPASMSPNTAVLPESDPSRPMHRLRPSQSQYSPTTFPFTSNYFNSSNHIGNNQLLPLPAPNFPPQIQANQVHPHHHHLYPASPQLSFGRVPNNETDSPLNMSATVSFPPPNSHLPPSQLYHHVPYQQQTHAHSHSPPQSIIMYSTDPTVVPRPYDPQEHPRHQQQQINSDHLRNYPHLPRHS